VNGDPARGFSLSTLFVLVTACAALIAGVTPLARHASAEGISASNLLGAMGAGFFGGMLLGLVLGLLQFRLSLAVPLGALAGGVVGLAAGMLVLLPQGLLFTSAVAMIVGSALVVAVAMVTRRVNG
jgi:F0F1-type ATP synthase assembly protein I